MNGRHVAEPTQTNEYPYLEQIHGEDPARFLETNELTATARIGAIRYPAILEAYEYVAKQITVGSYRNSILEAIDERKADLGICDELTESPTADPVAATDGGTELSYDESDETADTVGSDEIHPDADGLETGQVLVVTRGEQTEYVWPQTEAADEPFILRLFDAEGDQQMELTLSQRDLFSRSHDHDSEKRPVSEIDKTAPKLAASNGGDQ